MMSKIWLGIIAVAVLFGLANGRGDLLTHGAVQGAESAVSTCLTLAAGYALWMGLLNILQ